MVSMWVIWLAIAVVMFIIEAVTTGLATLWFGIGALVAMIMDLCGASVPAQVIVMAIVSIVCFVLCMIWVRPKLESLRKKNIHRKRRRGNRAFEQYRGQRTGKGRRTDLECQGRSGYRRRHQGYRQSN